MKGKRTIRKNIVDTENKEYLTGIIGVSEEDQRNETQNLKYIVRL